MVSDQRHAAAALYPVPIVQEAGWDSDPVWTQRLQEKSFASDGDRTPDVAFITYFFKGKYQ
jgi:hypothetical protein